MSPRSKKKEPKSRKKAATPRKKEYVWIYYGHSVLISKFSWYEFHKDVQEHIEQAYLNKKKTCKIYVFGVIWTIDFERMMRYKNMPTSLIIKRIPRSSVKKFGVKGISGIPYAARMEGFKQGDDICSVCLYKLTIPVRIPTCGHEFCYCCLKGNYHVGFDCPVCRGKIEDDVFEYPFRYDLDIHTECPTEYVEQCTTMFNKADKKDNGSGKPTFELADPLRRSQRSTRTKFYWIYASTSFGYYRYEPKDERYLEECYLRKLESCTMNICGRKMLINLKDGVQVREEGHRRKILRINSNDIIKYRVKGIAGICCLAQPVDDDAW